MHDGMMKIAENSRENDEDERQYSCTDTESSPKSVWERWDEEKESQRREQLQREINSLEIERNRIRTGNKCIVVTNLMGYLRFLPDMKNTSNLEFDLDKKTSIKRDDILELLDKLLREGRINNGNLLT